MIDDRLSIGDLARASGTKVVTVRYYERLTLIGISKSSILETDGLAGVTVLSGVGFRSPHHGCQG
jgi:hypothetical protein